MWKAKYDIAWHTKHTWLKLDFYIMSFGNKLGTINATRFLNLIFNISESRFEGYPALRHGSFHPFYILYNIVRIIVLLYMLYMPLKFRLFIDY